MPNSTPVVVVRELTSHGYNADRDAVTLLADEPDPARAVEHVVEHAPADVLTISAAQVRDALDARDDDAERDDRPGPSTDAATQPSEDASAADIEPDDTASNDAVSTDTVPADTASESAPPKPQSSVSTERKKQNKTPESGGSPPEEKGVDSGGREVDASGVEDAMDADSIGEFERAIDDTLHELSISNDITGESTGTGEYTDFVSVFRDRYDRLSSKLRGRVNHRPTNALESMGGGSEAAIVGMVNDIRSTASGHWLIELEDTNGVFPALVMKDRDIAAHVDELLLDEVIAVEGSLAQDGGILFVDSMHFPDVPRTYKPNTADRHVQAALISDVHVGSQEFADYAWESFARWLHTEEAEHVEYLLIAGDMVEGVGVYPDQDDELDIVDIYEQYEAFAEKLKQVPGDMEIVMIPGNHDAVRLAEPQPAFDEELRDIMSAHDARITGNPSVVTVEGVNVLMYHGVSIDEVIAEHPSESVSYEDPHRAMEQLLKKRHVAPQFGGRLRVAPEKEDYLVIDDVPDVFHTGHVHKLGVGTYNNVRLVNSGCWQEQTAFQKSVNIDPDVATAPILDLDTLDVTVRKFEN
ncbi:DNA-directed DNA polymerase II small subunit [Salarchaeum sp. III]|uniref:DNA-directed DNA polymerase II small subunit n=1 Tax=Salarchaeum sp. III TaxID=3107927 RepID=UPI002EDB9F45